MSDDNKMIKNDTNRPSVSQIKSDLSQSLAAALAEWEQISSDVPALSKDEVKRREMQRLLKELQQQMKDLGLG